MIVAVSVVRVMEVPIDQVVDMVTVRDGRMTAVGPVNVSRVVPAALVVGRAVGRVGVVDFQLVLNNLPVRLLVMEVAVVEVVDVTVVLDCRVAAAGAVLVWVVFVSRGHDFFLRIPVRWHGGRRRLPVAVCQ